MITELDGKFHLRLSANDRADVLQAMKEAEIVPAFFASVKADLLVVLASIEDAMFLTMMFCLRT